MFTGKRVRMEIMLSHLFLFHVERRSNQMSVAIAVQLPAEFGFNAPFSLLQYEHVDITLGNISRRHITTEKSATTSRRNSQRRRSFVSN